MDLSLKRDMPLNFGPENGAMESGPFTSLTGAYPFPNEERLLKNPELKALAEKTLDDPAQKRMLQQMRYMYNLDPRFDEAAYLSAHKEVHSNDQLMADAGRIATALEDPSDPGEGKREYLKGAPFYNAMAHDILAGRPGPLTRYLTNKRNLLKFTEAIKLTVKFASDTWDEAERTGNQYDSLVYRKARFGDAEGLKKALKSGATVAVLDSMGGTALHVACSNGVCVKPLVEYGLEVNAPDYNGNTPLHCAAFFGKKDCVEFLLEKGAIIQFENDKGFTPTMMAELKKHNDIVELLRESDE